ncbi:MULTISPECIES: hypothetical protein [Wolbachia]|jgi:hypothetical protein|uniref:Uncharacterized protein n=3 Tax=cellular organisms TaxID=131567 RepID=A0A8X6EZY4_TRICU|nr:MULTISPECIES: hypothetical protein [Wolbachia]MDE5063898.1 hypothetical protein [Wolbachia endosymbiont of Drosophila chauvacae]MDU8941422.1 hypothetical protein [Wolbachia endosymbiont of Drosophila malagassya]MDX5487861.1 hypothetical protein [Wolbachia endosymbiont of Andrena praecox]MDX5496076.1 hypothetical protein [Wolbachia endosymbiont of Nomada fabriciana]MDX5497937.1 hypothetical protein [Wolbachia endosymbiont of Lasioglossum nitidulum]MDX5507191.1 hypothetical protein [Wolbachi
MSKTVKLILCLIIPIIGFIFYIKDHYFHTGYVEENVEVNFEPFFSSQPATVSELTDFDRGVLKVCGDWGAHPDKEDFKILLSCPQHQEVVKGIYK